MPPQLRPPAVFSFVFRKLFPIKLFCLATLAAFSPTIQAEQLELLIYSARKEHLIKPLLDTFAQRRNVKVHLVTGKDEALIERMKKSQAKVDVLLLADVGNLGYAVDRGVLQPFESETVSDKVPFQWRNSQLNSHLWTGLSLRARTIIYHPGRVRRDDLSSYEALADKKWKKRLCLRTSKKVYNKSLVAAMIIHDGYKATRAVVEGWVDNLATSPFAKDSHVIKAIAAGQCDVGVVNTYYLGREQSKNDDLPVRLFWSNQGGRGTHVNLSGAGIGFNAANKKEAVHLVEWLLSSSAQRVYAEANMEFPVVEGIPPDPIVEAWGDFVADSLPLQHLGSLQREAVQLMREAGYK